MDRKRILQVNMVIQPIVLVLALVVVGINIYEYFTQGEVHWVYIILGVMMIFNSTTFFLTSRRELKKLKETNPQGDNIE